MYNSKTCVRDSKRKSCFKKFQENNKKKSAKIHKVKEKDIDFRKAVWMRDYGSFPKSPIISDWKNVCTYWLSLDEDEQLQLTKLHRENFYMNENIDVAHWRGKGNNPELRDDPDNCCLMSRVFHSLIDQFINPLTNKAMTFEEREEIFIRIFDRIFNT
jgi:hypothetical protein